jgi:hypothetical protein
MKTFTLLVVLALSIQLSGCSRQSSGYTEEDVRKFVVPGTARDAIVERFGSPVYVQKNPKFEDGSTNVDEILFFSLPEPRPPQNESWVFSGFQVSLKDGKAVRWSASHRDTHVGP